MGCTDIFSGVSEGVLGVWDTIHESGKTICSDFLFVSPSPAKVDSVDKMK